MAPHAFGRVVHYVFDRYLLLPLGALIAFVWAQVAAESYFGFSIRASFLVNEVGMALFLGLVTQEIVDATRPGGGLHHWTRWSLALVTSVGGVLGAWLAYLLYVQLNYETVLGAGWPIAVAVDMAAAYFLLKLIFPRTSAAYPFLLFTALVSNGIALVVVGLAHPTVDTAPWAPGLILLAIGTAAFLRGWKVDVFWPYLVVCAPLAWVGLTRSGLHPALALAPIVPFLPHRARGVNFLEDVPNATDHVRRIEHEWAFIVQPVVFLFGLVNGGVELSAYGTGTWALVVSALVGRPLGMLAAIGAAVAMGWQLPKRTHWRDLVVVAWATSAGFTMALFVATGIWPVGPLLGEAKLGALLTASGALVALGLARLLHVGRFARPDEAMPRASGRHLHRPATALATAALNRMA